ncbi:hypothetical protein HanRHA438_Chr10g0445091 [Helianthus annuus]|uniref:Uncharacterized protein n=1 Tax=Helianthus annuus TaxID=4232 RepID=A0A9K3N453_HELAN|nr:hypothetical protein HanXRQr2_Chr10g0432551 [Helianthus annuus]KAJ0521062.1 hypothetical protein HanIR_Chr10g0466491 [Helianthus annuus]KAJ0878895.1 hypothetical protein HanRHA438_Chr10g0445091 [Helianthus annuus]
MWERELIRVEGFRCGGGFPVGSCVRGFTIILVDMCEEIKLTEEIQVDSHHLLCFFLNSATKKLTISPQSSLQKRSRSSSTEICVNYRDE